MSGTVLLELSGGTTFLETSGSFGRSYASASG